MVRLFGSVGVTLALLCGCGDVPLAGTSAGSGGAPGGKNRIVGVVGSTSSSSGTATSSSGSGGSFMGPSGATTEVDGRRITMGGDTFFIRGVCWNPIGAGGIQPDDLDYAGYVEQDAALMAAAGINAVRTYFPITDPAVLDVLYDHGIYVLNTVYNLGQDPVSVVDARIDAVKDHPAIAMWLVGNEWNYNNLYSNLSPSETVARVEAAAARIQTLDSRPVLTIYGEVPPPETVAAIPSVDGWGLNIYAGLGLNDAFDRWEALSPKPMFLAEYGADAYNANLPGEDVAAQAVATTTLTQLILDHAVTDGGVASGGTIFEWADEWWKDVGGTPGVHDTGGIAPGGGPHPDATFHEEWWGIVDVERAPRPAYDALKALYLP